MTAAVPFRFTPATHEYLLEDTGEVAQSITGMLKTTGLVDDTWFDEESSRRGDWVHAQTAAYDLGLLDRPEQVVHPYKGYLLAHVAAMAAVKPEILHVEEPSVHRAFRFAGRIDRVLLVRLVRGVWEIKSGVKSPSHRIQTALQAILDSDESGIPPTSTRRWCCYLQKNGRFKVEEHTDKRDYDRAAEVLRACGLAA